MIINIQDDFDLGKIAESGQCFRWQKRDENKYWIPHGDTSLTIEKLSEEEYCLDCSQEEYDSIWKDYFDMDEDYRQIRARIDAAQDPFLWAAAEHEKGIRILRQQPWEALVSFIISQNRNIPAIKKSIELMAAMAGERRTDFAGNNYYSFPSPEAILEIGETGLSECKLGYRSKYVLAAAEAVSAGQFQAAELMALDSAVSLARLMTLYGVGEKVATCVLLYGLHHLDAFPIDVWVRRILENEYPQGYPFERYRPYNGVYQQYMFAYYRKQGQLPISD